jgi:2,3-bisphosphoglycerate-dependent phosphoglycerate mutase
MKKLLTALLLLLCVGSLQAQNSDENVITSLYFIRHAEKNTSNPSEKDPDLITEGILRAAHWSLVFDHINFDAIYSTNYKRTRNTALPTVEQKNLTLTLYSPKNFDHLEFLKENKNKTVLIVGHSNTTPFIVNTIIGQALYKQIEDTNYRNLYIINITESGEIIHQLLAIE